jgi:hypothetical protein
MKFDGNDAHQSGCQKKTEIQTSVHFDTTSIPGPANKAGVPVQKRGCSD